MRTPRTTTMDPGTTRSVALDAHAQVGRYGIVRLLGVGGVGAVYLAHDATLARAVALKIFHFSTDDPDRDRDRVEREAQALARLHHPHVVAVYDVGAYDGRLFLTMEYVEGGTLRQWIEKRRTTAQVIEVLAAAGQGLAAAHAAGLVHRDFKLDNVLVARDGRVLVTDFGLATPVAASTDRSDEASDTSAPSADESPASALGWVAGTPGYVAPEAYRGATPDPRADQFSFGVTLYRCLYGRLPFPRRVARVGAPALARVGIHGRIGRPVRRALGRALEVEPERRFLNMQALLGALAPRRHGRRLPALIIGLVVTALVTVTLLRSRAAPHGTACAIGAERLTVSWNPEVAARIERVFLATATPYAATTFANLRARLDSYRAAWRAIFLETCVAAETRLHSAEVTESRTECLDVHARRFATLVAAVARAEPETLLAAVRSTALLPNPVDCATAPGLRSRVSSPVDPTVRREVGALRRSLGEIRTLIDLGNLAEARTRMAVAAPRIDRLGYLPLTAEAASVEADLHPNDRPRTVEALEATAWASEASGDDPLAARALTLLVETAGYHLGRFADAEAYARRADAIILRMGDPAPLRNELLLATANVWFKAGRDDDAIAIAERAAAYYRQTPAAAPETRIAAQVRVGALLRRRGQFVAALAAYREGQVIADAELGPDHPGEASLFNNLGSLHATMGELGPAELLLESADRVVRDHFGADSSLRALPLINLGLVARLRGQPRQARDRFEAALAVQPLDDPGRWLTQARIGGARCEASASARGQAEVEQALAGLPLDQPAQRAVRSEALLELASCRQWGGAQRRAIRATEQAIAAVVDTPDRERLARARIALAARVVRSDPGRARALLGEIAAVRTVAELPAELVAAAAAVAARLPGASRP